MRRCYCFVPRTSLLVLALLSVRQTIDTHAFAVLQQRPTHSTLSSWKVQTETTPFLSLRHQQRYHHSIPAPLGSYQMLTDGNRRRQRRTVPTKISTGSAALFAQSSGSLDDNDNDERRKVLLSRTGPHFKVDRRSGTIEFGATANLVTQLPLHQQASSNDATTNMIDLWLLDENRGLAMSIWDPKLMKDLGNNIYRLQIMTLQFVTITLAPWVDVRMETTVINNTEQKVDKPEFIVQSIGFDPNIQLLPGMRINGNALGIVIEVAGVLRPGVDGSSVTGAIAFQTSGNLPPPLRLLPDAVLKAASDTINTTIVNFAIQSFQKGAKMNFQQFLKQYELKMKSI